MCYPFSSLKSILIARAGSLDAKWATSQRITPSASTLGRPN
jgi:hypothetical protein